MGLYGDRVFPRILNVVMNTKTTREIRARVCSRLSGEVIEIGFGTGLNLPRLPPAVTRLLAVDPMQLGRELARDRLAAAEIPVVFVGLDGQSLPVEDQSVEAALCTWTLCSISDSVAAIREVSRVLRPGGTLHFAEHGRSPEAKVEKWQQRLNGLQQRVACGCTLTRDIPAIIEAGGLEIERLDAFYAKGDPKTHGWTFEGVARLA